MLKFRKAQIEDSALYFEWANDALVRAQSYHSNPILWDAHNTWFLTKINDSTCVMLVFQNALNENIGQVRIQKETENNAIISISVAKLQRGKGYAKQLIDRATHYFLNENPNFTINAYIKLSNLGSKKAFENAGYCYAETIVYKSVESFHYIKTLQ